MTDWIQAAGIVVVLLAWWPMSNTGKELRDYAKFYWAFTEHERETR